MIFQDLGVHTIMYGLNVGTSYCGVSNSDSRVSSSVLRLPGQLTQVKYSSNAGISSVLGECG